MFNAILISICIALMFIGVLGWVLVTAMEDVLDQDSADQAMIGLLDPDQDE